MADVGTGLTERLDDPLSLLLLFATLDVEMGSERHKLRQRACEIKRCGTYMMMALGVATQTLAGSVGTYVTVPQEQSSRLNHVGNVRGLSTVENSPKETP